MKRNQTMTPAQRKNLSISMKLHYARKKAEKQFAPHIVSPPPGLQFWAIEQQGGELVLTPSNDGPQLFMLRERAEFIRRSYYASGKLVPLTVLGLASEPCNYKFRIAP